MALNPVASGLLLGTITGAATGFLLGGPAGAVVGGIAGGTMGASQGSEQQKATRAVQQGVKNQLFTNAANENRLADAQYNKRAASLGVTTGSAAGLPSGANASQTGAVLQSVNGLDQVNLLG